MIAIDVQDKAIAEIRGYTNQISGFFHTRIDSLISAHGLPFYMNARTFAGPRGTPKSCYSNALNLLICTDYAFTYCEGYVHIGIVPIEHAWLIDGEGNVIDPTLPEPDGEPGKAMGYFGIPFKSQYVCHVARKTKVSGILSYTNLDLMQDKVPVETFLNTEWKTS